MDNCTHLSSILNIQHRDSFGKYHGFPIFYKAPTMAEFQFIIDNMKAKLASWKTKILNQAGRTTFTRASLNSIPTHVMQYIQLPHKIAQQVDNIQRDFIWGTTNERRMMHMIKWEVITQPKYSGGLGIHKTSTKNDTMHCALAWRLT